MIATLAYIGAVQLSAEGLDELIKQGIVPELVCTLHPHLAYRHSDYADLRPIAEANGIPLLYVDNINTLDVMTALRDLQPDYIFVIGWSQIIKSELLHLPQKSTVGFHFAYLPRNRGRAAIPWAILNQEKEAGVSLMHLDEGIDSGNLVTQRSYPVEPDETSETLYKKVCGGLRQMMGEVASLLQRGVELPSIPQDHSRATYLAKRTADDGWIDWEKSASDIERIIRANGHPYPGAFTIYDNQRLIIWKARRRVSYNQTGTIGQVLAVNEDGSVIVQCGSGWLDLLEVQRDEDTPSSAGQCFKRIHERLGINIYQLWKAHRELTDKIEELAKKQLI